ncbi:hypothetical protein ACIQXF_07270 [Lysinibacillus sp. NPDC097231]|uniref:hypothetical protein n=1 Tax=Lysinibacillus sp. NPDC097231 TaxID=3364142 RepID=UPI00382B3225
MEVEKQRLIYLGSRMLVVGLISCIIFQSHSHFLTREIAIDHYVGNHIAYDLA